MIEYNHDVFSNSTWEHIKCSSSRNNFSNVCDFYFIKFLVFFFLSNSVKLEGREKN